MIHNAPPPKYLHKQPVDDTGTLLLGTLAQVVVQHLTAAHADVLALRQGLANIHLAVGWGDHLHLGHLAVDNLHGQVEFINHAQRDGTTARLCVCVGGGMVVVLF